VSWLERLFGGRKKEQAVEGDPRGGMQAEEYRMADPREVVETEDVAMGGPGGAPQEETTPEQRRDEQR
jgi:hypothetical protein